MRLYHPPEKCEKRSGRSITRLKRGLTQPEGHREFNRMLGGYDIFVLIIVLLAVLTLFLGVKTVPQGYNWTVERFGRYTRMLRPGLNLVVPFIDRIGRKMNVTTRLRPGLSIRVKRPNRSTV